MNHKSAIIFTMYIWFKKRIHPKNPEVTSEEEKRNIQFERWEENPRIMFLVKTTESGRDNVS